MYMVLEGFVECRRMGIVVKESWHLGTIVQLSGQDMDVHIHLEQSPKKASMYLVCITQNHIPAFSGLHEEHTKCMAVVQYFS